ncbi:MAG TPA: thiamine pyrophosphate-dependent enzyme [Paenibacillus sp.]|jgi:acetolactate synthase-1/2/3 large subunit
MNNNNLGMVRQFQDQYFEGRRQSTVQSYSCPDLVKIVRAFGMKALMIDSNEQAQLTIDEALQTEGPVFVELKLEMDTTVNPKLAVNRPIEDMSPYLDHTELNSFMLIDIDTKEE